MSFEPECKPFDYPEAPWNRCCPPGSQRMPERLQAVLPSAGTAASTLSPCCCGTPARLQQVTYGSTFLPWFPASIAIAVPPEKATATPSDPGKLDKTQIEELMELFTSPNGPPPTADIIKMVKSWCGTE